MLIKQIKEYLNEEEYQNIFAEINDDKDVSIDDFTQYAWKHKKDDALFYKDVDGRTNLIPEALINGKYETEEYTIFLIANVKEHFVILKNNKINQNILKEG